MRSVYCPPNSLSPEFHCFPILATQEPCPRPVQALRCLKGIETVSALTIVVETQDFQRFPTAAAVMSVTGSGPSEASSGERVRRGRITKTGNAHLRRVLGEAAWCTRHGQVVSREVALRRRNAGPAVLAMARKAQARLHRRDWRVVSRGKRQTVAVTAVAREWAGVMWAIGPPVPMAETSSGLSDGTRIQRSHGQRRGTENPRVLEVAPPREPVMTPALSSRQLPTNLLRDQRACEAADVRVRRSSR